MGRRVKGTVTYSFGVGGRFAHDSSKFYSRRLIESFAERYKREELISEEQEFPKELINKILYKSSENMSEIPNNSVHLMITSPPYNVGKEYDNDLDFYSYRSFLKRVWREVYRVLVPGGRACINVANLGRKPYIPLHAFIIQDMLEIGFLMRGEVIWVKKGGGAPSTAWGTWLSAKNPVIRDEHEYILIFSKGTYERKKSKSKRDTITRDEFLTYTRSVWYMKPESAKKVGHPAPFPVELPYRFIQLYTFEGDVVLDPFMGSGSTALASIKTSRFYIGYEINQEYIELANIRLKNSLQED
ncbi:MAG: site-specific DNA-methyltransferase [Hydrogenothermaceae bacterium]|nr:site-specific DNA-methyltransferase [Hydrogenothermaceae bacterium]